LEGGGPGLWLIGPDVHGPRGLMGGGNEGMERAAETLETLLTEEQMQRYSRQILLEQVGAEGQRKLLDSRVLVVGAGGLGSPASIYLAVAGVGTIGIVDGDRVDLTNLHRQILHFDRDLGRPKTQSARRHLEDLNPDVQVITYQEVLSRENALDIIREYDLVVNGCDNFPTRYLVNDACVFLRKPLVDASILQFEGQATVFLPGQGCYRCLYPTPPPPGMVPSCAEAGIIGAVAGHLGTLQALEAIKILLGIGRPLVSRLILYDGLNGSYRTVRWRRDPACPVCGDNPTVTELIDYHEFCGVPAPQPRVAPREEGAEVSWELEPRQAAEKIRAGGVQVVDVREPWEFQRGRVPGSLLIPLEALDSRMRELDPSRETVVVCHVGQRSARAAERLRRAGFQRVYNLKGGMVAWMNQRLPVERG